MRVSLREITLYRFRYLILYVLFVALLVFLLSVELGRVPYGLSSAEMESAARSVTLNLTNAPADAVINAPYHVLQKASISAFGLSALSIKLPSIILALLLAAAITGVIRRFFRYSATIITALLMISSLPFLTMGRTGAPIIMLSFFSALMMVAGSSVVTKAPGKLFWKSLTVAAGIGLLYTPLGIYPLIAFILAGVLHPHLRYHITHTKLHEWIIIGLVAIASLALLVVAVIREPSILLTLAGIPSQLPGLQEIWTNLLYLANALLNIFTPDYGLIATPIFGLPLLALMTFGALQLMFDHHSARTYFIMGWVGAFVVILSLNTEHVLSIFVPAVMLMAVGIKAFLREWYSLFPRNPYARLAALLPLSILIIGIVSSETTRYFYGYRHSTLVAASAYDPTLKPLKTQLSSLADDEGTGRIFLVAPPDNRAFYDLLRREYSKLELNTQPPATLKAGEYTVVLTRDGEQLAPNSYRLHRIGASLEKNAMPLFLVYRDAN